MTVLNTLFQMIAKLHGSVGRWSFLPLLKSGAIGRGSCQLGTTTLLAIVERAKDGMSLSGFRMSEGFNFAAALLTRNSAPDCGMVEKKVLGSREKEIGYEY